MNGSGPLMQPDSWFRHLFWMTRILEILENDEEIDCHLRSLFWVDFMCHIWGVLDHLQNISKEQKENVSLNCKVIHSSCYCYSSAFPRSGLIRAESR